MIQSAMALRTVSIQSPSLAEVVDEGLEKVQEKNNVGQKLHNSAAFHAVLLASPPESGIISLQAQAHVLPDLKLCKEVPLMISYRKLAMRVLGHSPVSAVKTARRSTAKRAAALALTAALVVGMTLPAFAQDWYIEDGDISISAGENGNNVTQGSTTKENDTDTVIKSKDSSTASSNTVTIDADEGKTVNVTLDNVTINVDEGYKYGYDSNAYKTAVSVTGSGNTNIELNGNNTLTSGYGHAGLEHNKTDDSGTLTIQDEKNDDGSAKGSASDTTGSLTATGGYHGAGIGGSDGHDGQATITGGEIIANGGSLGAGIGGGAGDTDAVGGDGDVTISGGTITATGGSLGAAGIGGGAYGNGTVTVTDGDITAKATGRYGAGIGGGYGAIPEDTLIGGNGTVTISGGTITEASGGYMAAGIGSGFQGLGTVTIEGDAVIKNAQGGEAGAGIGSGTRGDSNILIRGNAIIENAESKTGGAGIGSGQGFYYEDDDGLLVIDSTVGNVTIEGNAKIENAKSGYGGSGIGGGAIGIGNVIIRGNAQIGNATGGEEGAGIGGGALGTGDVTIEGNVTIGNAQGGAGAAGIGGGAETQPDTEDTRNKVSIKSTEAGSPNITATGGGVLNDENYPLAGAAAIGSGSVVDGATEVKSDITVEGKVTIDATGGGDVAIGDSINGETRFSGLQVGTTITRRNAKGDDVSQPGDVVREQAPTEGAEAPSTGSVEVERPVTVEGLYVTNILGKQITHTCTQNGTTLTIRANGIVTSAHLTLGMVRTLKAQGVKTLVFTTLLSRSTTVSVDALLAAEPDAPDETAVVWTHTGPRAALTIGGADHSALLK